MRLYRSLLLAILTNFVMPTSAMAQGTPPVETRLTADQIAAVAMFATDVSVSVLQHEIGHLFIHEFDFPVLGNEEDAADAAGALMMLSGENDEATQALSDGALAWLLMHNARGTDDYSPADYYDTHSLSIQRAYKLVCLMVGSDPQAFDKVAEQYQLDPDRRESCAEDYQQALNSWTRLLEPHRSTGRAGAGKITVRYEPAAPERAAVAALLKQTEFLEEAAQRLSTTFDLPRDLTFRATECDGVENAWYDDEQAEIVFCYDLTGFFLDLAAANVADAESGRDDESLSAADADHDGNLSFVEATSHWPNLTKDKFDAADTDKNGKLNAEELKSADMPRHRTPM